MLRLVLWFGVACFVCSFVNVFVVAGAIDVIRAIQGQLEIRISFLLLSSSINNSSSSREKEKKTLCHLTQPIELTPCSLRFLHRAFHQSWLINGRKPLITSKCNFGRLSFEWSLHFCVESSTIQRWYLSRTRRIYEDEREKIKTEMKEKYQSNSNAIQIERSNSCRYFNHSSAIQTIWFHMQWICKPYFKLSFENET